MTAIIIPRKPRSQPQGRVEVDWGGELAQTGGIFAVMLPTMGILRPRGVESLLPLVGGRVAPMRSGLALAANGGTSDGFQSVQNFSDFDGLTRLSTYIEGVFPTASASISGRWGGGGSYGGVITLWESGQIVTLVISKSDDAGQWVGRRTAAAAAGHVRYGMTWSGGGSQNCYLNGAESSGSFWLSGSASAIESAAKPLNFCRNVDAASGAGDAQVAVQILGSRAWSAEYHNAIADNPWQIFRADPIRIYSLPSGPVGISWSSLTASNITQTGARLTLGGITR